MIIPGENILESYTFFYNGLRGAIWIGETVMATTMLLSETQDAWMLERALDELEVLADNRGRKLYITNFCSQIIKDMMDERNYIQETQKFASEEGTWQSVVRFYAPKTSVRDSLLPLVPFVGYNGAEIKGRKKI